MEAVTVEVEVVVAAAAARAAVNDATPPTGGGGWRGRYPPGGGGTAAMGRRAVAGGGGGWCGWAWGGWRWTADAVGVCPRRCGGRKGAGGGKGEGEGQWGCGVGVTVGMPAGCGTGERTMVAVDRPDPQGVHRAPPSTRQTGGAGSGGVPSYGGAVHAPRGRPAPLLLRACQRTSRGVGGRREAGRGRGGEGGSSDGSAAYPPRRAPPPPPIPCVRARRSRWLAVPRRAAPRPPLPSFPSPPFPPLSPAAPLSPEGGGGGGRERGKGCTRHAAGVRRTGNAAGGGRPRGWGGGTVAVSVLLGGGGGSGKTKRPRRVPLCAVYIVGGPARSGLYCTGWWAKRLHRGGWGSVAGPEDAGSAAPAPKIQTCDHPIPGMGSP